jgi:hypothetical protein
MTAGAHHDHRPLLTAEKTWLFRMYLKQGDQAKQIEFPGVLRGAPGEASKQGNVRTVGTGLGGQVNQKPVQQALTIHLREFQDALAKLPLQGVSQAQELSLGFPNRLHRTPCEYPFLVRGGLPQVHLSPAQ